jgi:hypothetical protein
MKKNYSEEAIIKRRSYTKKWKEKNLEKVALKKQEWMCIPKNRIKQCLYAAKKRAKEKNIEFDICLEDFLPIPTHCPILDIELNYQGTKLRGFVNNSPSLDRIDSSKGYIKGNVMIISWRANRIKSDATIGELKKILNYMEKQ